jgi:VWFA-related protein
VAGVLLIGGLPAAAQPTFKSGVDLVRFDVRVVDGSGRPITDIRPEELEIYDGGQLLPIVLFQRVTEPAGSYVDEAIRAVSAEVSSNEAFPRGHLYILIFDQQHISPGNEQRSRQAAEQFIRMRVRPNDRVALYALPGPGPQIGFTVDKIKAIKELASIRGMAEKRIDSPLGAMTVYEAHRVIEGDETLIGDLLARMGTEAGSDVAASNIDPLATTARRAAASDDATVARKLLVENARTVVNQSDSASRDFLQRLADTILGFRDVEGRKTVVLFSEGFFQDNLTRELEVVAAAAAQSYCVFYSFDLNRRDAGLTEATAPLTTQATEIQAKIAPLGTLAVETDGMLVIDASTRSAAMLDRIADQAHDYYLVGFTPSPKAEDERGKYRRVTIRVNRPGARVSARTGYAVKTAATTPADRRRAIDTVLSAPFVQQGLKIDYTTYVMKAPETGRQRVVLSLSAGLPLQSRPGDAADVVFVARDIRDGRVIASGSDTIPLPTSVTGKGPLGTGTWRVQFDAPPGAYLMRTVVREPGGLVGSADRRVEVRPLDGPDLTVSDLVIGSALAGLPVHPRAYSGDGLSGVIEAYARSQTQMDRLAVRIELRDAADTARTSLSAEVEPPIKEDTGLMRRAAFTMPLDGVPPGHYVAHAVVTARGEVVAERTRQVEVLAGHAPAASADAASSKAASPVEVTGGDLARRYLAALQDGARGTTTASAARYAVDGQWERVEAELARLADATSAIPQALRGFALFVREDYSGAAGALRTALDADPQNALTAFFLGWAEEGAGDSRAAIGSWRNAARLDPTLVSAHLALAEGYLRLAEPALAAQALKAGLAALPSSAELQSRLQEIERMKR